MSHPCLSVSHQLSLVLPDSRMFVLCTFTLVTQRAQEQNNHRHKQASQSLLPLLNIQGAEAGQQKNCQMWGRKCYNG